MEKHHLRTLWPFITPPPAKMRNKNKTNTKLKTKRFGGGDDGEMSVGDPQLCSSHWMSCTYRHYCHPFDLPRNPMLALETFPYFGLKNVFGCRHQTDYTQKVLFGWWSVALESLPLPPTCSLGKFFMLFCINRRHVRRMHFSVRHKHVEKVSLCNAGRLVPNFMSSCVFC